MPEKNDIALAELEKCVPSFNIMRAPICLPTSELFSGSKDKGHIFRKLNFH